MLSFRRKSKIKNTILKISFAILFLVFILCICAIDSTIYTTQIYIIAIISGGLLTLLAYLNRNYINEYLNK